jgi:broad specificity phosphatase PhoE
MRLLLARHAQSRGNHELRLQGRVEFPLTDHGRSQARGLAGRVASWGLDAVYSSPIGRALETAETVAGQCNLTVKQEPRLQEYDFGELLSGLTWEEIRRKQPHIVAALTGDDSDFPRYPGEEGRGAFRERVCSAMREIGEAHAEDDTVLVVTHAGPITVFLFDILGRHYARPIPFTIDNASLTTVQYNARAASGARGTVITALNDTCHHKTAAPAPAHGRS